jgi:CDP-diglyceride synthetase
MKATNKTMSWVYTLYSCLAYALIMGVLLIVKRESYFENPSNAVKIGVWGYLIIGLCLIIFASRIGNITAKIKPALLFCIVGVILCELVKQAMVELQLVLWVSLAASAVSTVFADVAEVYKKNSEVIIDGISQPNKAPALPQKEAWARAFGINFISEGDD